VRPFDVAEHLDSPETIATYLNEAFETGDMAFMLSAIREVARARGMTAVAKVSRARRSTAPSTGMAPRICDLDERHCRVWPSPQRAPSQGEPLVTGSGTPTLDTIARVSSQASKLLRLDREIAARAQNAATQSIMKKHAIIAN
jgi:DNA-binding phage protein